MAETTGEVVVANHTMNARQAVLGSLLVIVGIGLVVGALLQLFG
jgi:hypothetical protein